MKLSQLVIETRDVTYAPGQTFSVRGISLEDLMLVGRDHTPAFSAIFNKIRDQIESGEPFTKEGLQAMLVSVAREFPPAVAAIIAIANDEYTAEGLAVVKKLGVGVQVEAIYNIVQLSMRTEVEVKKLEEMVLGLVQGMTGLLQKANSLNPTSNGSSTSASM